MLLRLTLVLGSEPAPSDAQLDEVGTLLEDVRETSLGEERRSPERERRERSCVAEEVQEVRVRDVDFDERDFSEAARVGASGWERRRVGGDPTEA